MTDRYGGCRWAIQWSSIPKHPCAIPQVYHFATEAERAEWVAKNPGRREAVGVRSKHVSAWRTEQARASR